MSKLPPSQRPPRRRRIAPILLGLALLVLGVAVAVFFFARRQIGKTLATKLGERLAEDGVFIGWKSADWLPDAGMRMHGLAVYRDAAKHERLALLDIVTVNRGDPSWLRWDKVTFKTANTHLLLGSGAAETRLEQLNMFLRVQ